MNIPKGYKLVPVETTEEMNESGCQGYMAADGSAWVMHKSSMEAAYKAMLAAAPAPPQPIYDEAKERELFEAFYSERAKTLPLPLGSPIRYGGGQYVNDFALFGWLVWLKCAQSRAKSGEVDHE